MTPGVALLVFGAAVVWVALIMFGVAVVVWRIT